VNEKNGPCIVKTEGLKKGQIVAAEAGGIRVTKWKDKKKYIVKLHILWPHSDS
jgi:hypothetical protein